MNDTPTYDDLKAEAAARWRLTQQQRDARIAAEQAAIAQMPDVINAPPPNTPLPPLLTTPDMTCPACEGVNFVVLRYGCVNGVRDKMDLACQQCGAVRTWNWTEGAWVS